jgi:hypothetical protein
MNWETYCTSVHRETPQKTNKDAKYTIHQLVRLSAMD